VQEAIAPVFGSSREFSDQEVLGGSGRRRYLPVLYDRDAVDRIIGELRIPDLQSILTKPGLRRRSLMLRPQDPCASIENGSKQHLRSMQRDLRRRRSV